MRGLERNKRLIYYALYFGEEQILDENGNKTSETEPVYGTPTALEVNISAAAGEDAVNAFGMFTGYTRTMTVTDTNCPIEEQTAVWFGISPTRSHNYVVTRKADSLNGIMYALQEVTVS